MKGILYVLVDLCQQNYLLGSHIIAGNLLKVTIKTNNLTQTSLSTRCNLKSIHYFVCFPARAEMYSIQHYVIKFASDVWQVGGFLWLLRFPPPTKLIAEILLKVALNTITLTLCVFILKCVYSNNVGFTTNYLCNQCLSPLMLWVRIRSGRGVLDTTLSDKVCQWLSRDRSVVFSWSSGFLHQ
jgi:hypothetical protein